MVLRLILTAALIAGCVWLITSETITGWLVWLDVAFIVSMVLGTLVTMFDSRRAG